MLNQNQFIRSRLFWDFPWVYPKSLKLEIFLIYISSMVVDVSGNFYKHPTKKSESLCVIYFNIYSKVDFLKMKECQVNVQMPWQAPSSSSKAAVLIMVKPVGMGFVRPASSELRTRFSNDVHRASIDLISIRSFADTNGIYLV
jgi:hypothetical protein